jgi:hypothetical protein
MVLSWSFGEVIDGRYGRVHDNQGNQNLVWLAKKDLPRKVEVYQPDTSCVRCEQTIVRCVRTCGRGRKSVFIVFKQPCSLHVSLSSSANWLRNHEEGQIWCILVVSCSPQQMYANSTTEEIIIVKKDYFF